MRILIVQTAFLGDVVLTLPLIAAAHQHFPGARVEVLTTPANAPVLCDQPGVDAVIPYDKRGTQRGLRGLLDMARALRARGYDLALSPHGSLRSAVLLASSGIPRRIGFARPLTRWAYTSTVPRQSAAHEVERNLQLLTACGAPRGPRTWQLSLYVTPATRQTARQDLARRGMGQGERLVGLIPGSQWDTKRWPAERFAELVNVLQQPGEVRVALFGGPQDLPIAQTIASTCQAPVIDLVGQTPLRELAAYLDCCTVVVSNDTGPMHIAAALNKPIVALYGPTTPALGFSPYGVVWEEASVVLECRPCHAHGPQRCPRSHWHCMLDLSVDQVVAGVQRLMQVAVAKPECQR